MKYNIEVKTNYFQNKQKAKWSNILMDIKHSDFYNGNFYFFLKFSFFGSKIQNFSIFGSKQDDHVYVVGRRDMFGIKRAQSCVGVKMTGMV